VCRSKVRERTRSREEDWGTLPEYVVCCGRGRKQAQRPLAGSPRLTLGASAFLDCIRCCNRPERAVGSARAAWLLRRQNSRHAAPRQTTAGGRLRKPTEFALLLADTAEQHAAASARPHSGGCLEAPGGPGALWGLAGAAAVPIIAVRIERAGPTEALRLTDGKSWRPRYAWLPRCAVDRSRRPHSPRWCENYAYSICATVGGVRARDRAPVTLACSGGSACGRHQLRSGPHRLRAARRSGIPRKRGAPDRDRMPMAWREQVSALPGASVASQWTAISFPRTLSKRESASGSRCATGLDAGTTNLPLAGVLLACVTVKRCSRNAGPKSDSARGRVLDHPMGH
jgi:hypothetical protein